MGTVLVRPLSSGATAVLIGVPAVLPWSVAEIRWEPVCLGPVPRRGGVGAGESGAESDSDSVEAEYVRFIFEPYGFVRGTRGTWKGPRAGVCTMATLDSAAAPFNVHESGGC